MADRRSSWGRRRPASRQRLAEVGRRRVGAEGLLGVLVLEHDREDVLDLRQGGRCTAPRARDADATAGGHGADALPSRGARGTEQAGAAGQQRDQHREAVAVTDRLQDRLETGHRG